MCLPVIGQAFLHKLHVEIILHHHSLEVTMIQQSLARGRDLASRYTCRIHLGLTDSFIHLYSSEIKVDNRNYLSIDI